MGILHIKYLIILFIININKGKNKFSKDTILNKVIVTTMFEGILVVISSAMSYDLDIISKTRKPIITVD